MIKGRTYAVRIKGIQYWCGWLCNLAPRGHRTYQFHYGYTYKVTNPVTSSWLTRWMDKRKRFTKRIGK